MIKKVESARKPIGKTGTTRVVPKEIIEKNQKEEKNEKLDVTKNMHSTIEDVKVKAIEGDKANEGSVISRAMQGQNSIIDPKIMEYEAPDKKVDYDIDLDPRIISFLFSLDGEGFNPIEGSDDSINSLEKIRNAMNIGDTDTNPTVKKQWDNVNNPFFISEEMEKFFYDYLEIDKEKDNNRLTFVGDK